MCPCKDCEVREIGCHSRCSGYIKWKKEMEEMNKKIKMEKEMYGIIRNRYG